MIAMNTKTKWFVAKILNGLIRQYWTVLNNSGLSFTVPKSTI